MLRQAQSGDVEAFAELFESFRPMLTAVACRLIGPDLCGDVVMETYLKAWRGLKRFGWRSSVSTWLCRIARNCALDFRRRENRDAARRVPEQAGDGPPLLARIADTSARAPDEELIHRELVSQVQTAVAQLSKNHRTALLLREVDGMPYRDIAAAMGTSIGTVMSRLFHARRNLQRIVRRMQ